jgi:hypothetical protein
VAHVDAVRVHVRQPQLGEIGQAPEPFLRRRARHRETLPDRSLLPDRTGNRERFFHSDNAHNLLQPGHAFLQFAQVPVFYQVFDTK